MLLAGWHAAAPGWLPPTAGNLAASCGRLDAARWHAAGWLPPTAGWHVAGWLDGLLVAGMLVAGSQAGK